MTLPRSALILTGFGFLDFGADYALWPLPMARLTDTPLPTPTGRIDFAAVYGGLQLGFGLFLLVCARRPIWTEAGLWGATAALAGSRTGPSVERSGGRGSSHPRYRGGELAALAGGPLRPDFRATTMSLSFGDAPDHDHLKARGSMLLLAAPAGPASRRRTPARRC